MQVAGSHYRAGKQHWDVVEDHAVGYCEAQVTRYITRWRKKDGPVALDKADHYLTKLMELHVEKARVNRSGTGVPLSVLHAFAEANELTPLETLACDAVFNWRDAADLAAARGLLARLREEAKAAT
jgi:hypothetical protein